MLEKLRAKLVEMKKAPGSDNAQLKVAWNTMLKRAPPSCTPLPSGGQLVHEACHLDAGVAARLLLLAPCCQLCPATSGFADRWNTPIICDYSVKSYFVDSIGACVGSSGQFLEPQVLSPSLASNISVAGVIRNWCFTPGVGAVPLIPKALTKPDNRSS